MVVYLVLIKHPKIRVEWGEVAVFTQQKKPQYLKIGQRLMTSRKLHTRFQLVPKSTTLDDLEWSYALCFKMHAFFGAHHETLNYIFLFLP